MTRRWLGAWQHGGSRRRWREGAVAAVGGDGRPDLGPGGAGQGQRGLRASAPTVAVTGGGGGATALAGGRAGRDPGVLPAGQRRRRIWDPR